MGFWRVSLFAALALGVASGNAPAQDPTIDQLLNKLPPPEKLVKPSVQQAIQKQDAALKDPLVPTIVSELNRGNVSAGINAARALAKKYPESAAAQEVEALIAFLIHQYPESGAALRRALAIQ